VSVLDSGTKGGLIVVGLCCPLLPVRLMGMMRIMGRNKNCGCHNSFLLISLGVWRSGTALRVRIVGNISKIDFLIFDKPSFFHFKFWFWCLTQSVAILDQAPITKFSVPFPRFVWGTAMSPACSACQLHWQRRGDHAGS
jgi:hypothetical protein